MSDQEPRYQLLNANGTLVGSLYQNADGDIAVLEAANNNELTLDADGTVSVPDLSAEQTFLGTLSSAPTDAAYATDEVALYFKSDGNLYKRPNGGPEEQVDTDTFGVTAEDGGAPVVTQATAIDFSTNLSVSDDGDGTVTIDATDTNTDTRTDISENGGLIVAETTDINFASNLSVSNDGDGTVTIDATDTNTDTRTDVSNNGTLVVSETSDINFGSDLTATDDGDGTVTVDSTVAVAIQSYADEFSLPDPTTISEPTIAYIEAEDDYVGVFQA